MFMQSKSKDFGLVRKLPRIKNQVSQDWRMNMTNKNNILKLCLIAVGVLINIIMPFVAMTLRLPIYLDSIGTVLITALLGTKYGMLTGIVGALISGVTFDIYSLYYFPVQVLTAAMTAYVFHHEKLQKHTLLSGLFISFPTSVASAFITAFVFGGLTASGSTYVIYFIQSLGFGLTFSCFLGQIVTEYFDKLLALILVKTFMQRGGNKYGTL